MRTLALLALGVVIAVLVLTVASAYSKSDTDCIGYTVNNGHTFCILKDGVRPVSQ